MTPHLASAVSRLALLALLALAHVATLLNIPTASPSTPPCCVDSSCGCNHEAGASHLPCCCSPHSGRNRQQTLTCHCREGEDERSVTSSTGGWEIELVPGPVWSLPRPGGPAAFDTTLAHGTLPLLIPDPVPRSSSAPSPGLYSA